MRFSQSAFADYHRARRIRAGLTVAGWTAGVSAVIGALILVGVASPSRAEASSVVATSATTAVGSSSTAAVPTTATSPEPGATQPQPSPTIAPANEPSGPAAFRIVVTATGYQVELNACQWVRMNLLGTAPFVGAHTSCGGAAVLTMKVGDLVTLMGQGLDGTYRVAEARDAHAGDLATTATAGMTASVVLQTCYHGTGGRERLVGLQPAP